MFVLQTITTLVIGLIGWGVKTAISDMKDAIKKNTVDIEKVKTELSELKSDLPLVYVLREDFIRTLNNVDKQMGDMNIKLDKILHYKVTKEG
jgi:mRNA-degrading endonuclease YafQ of YafQ-DinJ toxin-antitoxin module